MGRVCGKHGSEEKGVPDVIQLYYTHFGRSLFVRFGNLTMIYKMEHVGSQQLIPTLYGGR